LIDEKYVSDPSIFYVDMPGKVPPTSSKLKPENVSWDVTIPLDSKSSQEVPVVFMTGYRINYVSGGGITPLSGTSPMHGKGLPVCLYGNNAAFIHKDIQPDGSISHFFSDTFNPAGIQYQQLTPDGPLPSH
jgi:hypothetical protein